MLEIGRKIEEKVAYAWVITITENCFSLKMFLIVRTFFFNVGKLSVKLIGFRLLGFVKVAVFVHGGFLCFMPKPPFRKAKQKRRDRFAFAYSFLRYRQEPTHIISTKRFTPKDANPELLILLYV